MGRQVLEALIFLKERGFPTVIHLHSGNVLVQNGVARLAGLENTLLGFTSRIHPLIASRISQTISIDMICFGKIDLSYPSTHHFTFRRSRSCFSLFFSGHMLFEMCAGYELPSFKPNSMHLSDIEIYPQVYIHHALSFPFLHSCCLSVSISILPRFFPSKILALNMQLYLIDVVMRGLSQKYPTSVYNFALEYPIVKSRHEAIRSFVNVKFPERRITQ